MAGPSQAWLQSGMPDLSGMGIGTPPPAGPVFVPLGGPPAPVPAPEPVPAGPPAPPPPPAPAPAPVAAPAAPAPAPQQQAAPMPPDVQFVRVGGGSSPAREAPTMGPQQQGHLLASFAPQERAAEAIADRTQQQAINEQVVYQQQAEAAQARQEAAVAVKQRRTDELESLQQDYSDTVAKLGQMHLDSNRWWATKTTGDKIATGILAFLGGLGAMGTGGPNLAWEAIRRDMDADIEAQKFDYQTQMDRAKGAQNAFAMAMDRYGSEDAATAAARAAALDFAQAKVGQLQGQWKGIDAQNAADDLRGRIAAEREKTIASGFRYVPATQQASRYAMMVRGQMLPGTVSEDKAQTYTLEHGVKPAEAVDLKMVEGGIKAATEGKANAAKDAKDQAARWVPTSSTGKGYFAPTEKEGVEHRETQAKSEQVINLVDRVKSLREKAGKGNLAADKVGFETSDVASIKTEAKLLLGAINRGEKFGALDKGATDVLEAIIGDPLAVRDGPIGAKLDAIRQNALEERRRLEKSATGEKPSNTPEGTVKQAW